MVGVIQCADIKRQVNIVIMEFILRYSLFLVVVAKVPFVMIDKNGIVIALIYSSRIENES